MKKIFIVLLSVFTLVTYAQESVLLRLNYHKGDQFEMKMNVSQEMGAVMSMDINMTMSMDITSVTDDEYTSDMKIASMKMDMSQAGNKMSFDSKMKDDELDEAGKMLKSKMGGLMSAVISAKGNNLGEVLETTVEPNIPGASDMMNQSGKVVFPKEAVKVGDTWDMKQSQNGMDLNFIYKVISIEKESVKLEVSGTIGGMAEGTLSGNMHIDRASGNPINSLVNMEMTLQGQKMTTIATATMVKK